MIVDDFITAPAVVVGGGIAGLSTALGLEGCVVVANEPIGGGSSRLAQGGIAAALDRADSPALHAADTLRVAAELADPDIVALVTQAAAGRIEWLRALGVEFDLAPSGALQLGREAGHGRHRIVHAGGDRTGTEVMRAMRNAVLQRPDLQLLEDFELIDLVTSGDRAAGVLLEGPGGLRLAVLAPHVVLATGGIGGCFDRTTNPPTSRGAGLAAAARRGVRLADLEFVQFHPTALAVDADPLPLLTEALRGAGAVLLDESGSRFMTGIHADAELAPRDVVARSVFAMNEQGRQVLLDATGIADLPTRFPGACALAGAAGLDPTRQALPVATAAHFHMGGIATDPHGATSLTGLWACGELAATGLHGGNRLASNSLLEGLVFGERIARAIRAANLPAPRGSLEVPRRLWAPDTDKQRFSLLRHLVGRSLGPLRSAASMIAAMQRLNVWDPASRAEDDLVLIARNLLHSALGRCESRGAHQRSDYPQAAAGAPAHSYLRPEPAPVATLELLRSHVA
jgi:L-aspartate oxidase